MKIFKYRFSKLIIALISVGLVLSAVGFGINLYQVLRFPPTQATDPIMSTIQCVLMFLVTVALAVILISAFISSYYAVDDKHIITSFGIIKTKYVIAEIKSLELNKNTHKLSVYFHNEQYIVIVVKEDWYQDFVDEILKVNPDVIYTINSEPEQTNKK